jgi:hypothetical protein
VLVSVEADVVPRDRAGDSILIAVEQAIRA